MADSSIAVGSYNSTLSGKLVVRYNGARIQIMNADGTNMALVYSGGALPGNMKWSPDGSKILFHNDIGDGNVNDIYVMNADGTGLLRLTNNANQNFLADWSPDGTKIVYWSMPGSGGDIWIMNTDGSGNSQFTFTGNCSKPLWSPDGTKILYRNTGNYVIKNSDGTGIETVISTNQFDYITDYSADSTKLLLRRSVDGGTSYSIYIMNADGTGATLVPNTNGSSGISRWSPDESKIIFEGFPDLFIINVDGTNLINIASSLSFNLNLGGWKP